MKKNYAVNSIASFIGIFLLITNSFGQITLGSDNAGNYTTWPNGSNAGTGFTSWDLFTQNAGNAGHFLGDSSAQFFGNVNTSGKAFSMYGNPVGSNPTANAQRFLNNTGSTQVAGRSFLLPGQSFKVDLAIAFRNGYKGIDLFDQNFTQLFNFNVGNNIYSTTNNPNLGWAYDQASIFQLEVQQTDTNTFVVIITRGSDVYNSGNRSGQFSGFKVYVGNTEASSALNNLHFNNLLFQRCAVVTSWNGTAWSNGLPTINKQVAFSGNYTSSASIEACSISVTNGAVVTISGGATANTLTVDNNIDVAGVGSKLIIENNASLLQKNALAVNTGNINFKRDATPMRRLEFTYWGSPVAGQTLAGFSPSTNSGDFFVFNPDPAINNWGSETATNVMLPAKGYAIRAPNYFDTTLQTFNGEFVGIPNNGDISQNVIQLNPAILNYNLLSNPYPSAIDTNALLDGTTLGALYFWTHNTAINNNVFTINDYAIRTRTTSTAAISGGLVPVATIAAGQGFFASSSSSGSVVFKNSMRVAGSNSQFYRSAQTSQTDPINYYIHLNFTNTLGAFKQIAVGYQEFATNDYDFGTDALVATTGVVAFYSIIPPLNLGFGIQGRALPWGDVDQILIGFNANIAGDYTIAIDHFDPYFSDKNILLEDTLNGTFHDLKVAPYNFTTASGTFNSRFKLVYQNALLNATDFTNLDNKFFVYNSDNQITVNSTVAKIKGVAVYNVLGQLIVEQNNQNQNQVVMASIKKQNQILVIKTTLENGTIVTRKTIF